MKLMIAVESSIFGLKIPKVIGGSGVTSNQEEAKLFEKEEALSFATMIEECTSLKVVGFFLPYSLRSKSKEIDGVIYRRLFV